jgi:hypothetical protein
LELKELRELKELKTIALLWIFCPKPADLPIDMPPLKRMSVFAANGSA